MAFQTEVIGLKDLEQNLKAIARVVGGAELADSLAKGAMEVVWQAKQNIMAQGLHETGELWGSVKPIKVNQFRVDVKVDADHGAAHEYGLENQHITDRQRRFFWAKWAETGDEMWRALALSTTYTIPARPYLGGKFAHVVKEPTGG
jgi:hypothetical protein